MAEAFINHDLGDRWEAFSAGTQPSRLNPRAVQVMMEMGIDISGQRSKSLAEFIGRADLDIVITVCDDAREACPVFPGKVKQIHIGFQDPDPYSDQPDEVALPVFRKVRDEIREKIIGFLKESG
jgi:arsenate reductase